MRRRTLQPHPLDEARVLLVGIGGLGSPAALALADAGVGTLGLIDPDRVELSNLHRQPLYTDEDIGQPKVDAAARRLRRAHPGLELCTWQRRFEPDDAPLLDDFDVVLDGTDAIASKFAMSDAAVARGVPLVHAGAVGTRAQLLTILPGATACYRCLFEEPPPADDVPSCQDAGVLGPSVVLAGTLQAADALRLLTGARAMFAGRLLIVDTRLGTWRRVVVTPRPHCPACGVLHPDTGTPRSAEGV